MEEHQMSHIAGICVTRRLLDLQDQEGPPKGVGDSRFLMLSLLLASIMVN